MKRITWVAVGGVAVVLLGAAGAAARDNGPDTGELVSTALGNAMASAQNAFTVPESRSLGRTATAGRLSVAPASIKTLPTKANLEKQRAAGKSDLAKYMTGTALAKNVGTMNDWIDAQANGTDDPNFRPLGGGVSDVRLTTMKVNGSEADVTAEVDEWASMAQIGKDGSAEISRPTSTVIVTAHLTETGGHWLVDQYTWKFAPGSGP